MKQKVYFVEEWVSDIIATFKAWVTGVWDDTPEGQGAACRSGAPRRRNDHVAVELKSIRQVSLSSDLECLC